MRAMHTDYSSFYHTEIGQGSAASDLTSINKKQLAPWKKGRSFGLFPLCYSIGVLSGSAFFVWDKEISCYLFMFFSALLDEVFKTQTSAQVLSWHLFVQIFYLFLFLFFGCAVFGAPVLMLCILSKGLIHGAIYSCVLAGVYQVSAPVFLCKYVLFELGSTAVLFALLWEYHGTWWALFRIYFGKNAVSVIQKPKIERILSILVLNFLWYLIVWLFNQSFAPIAV